MATDRAVQRLRDVLGRGELPLMEVDERQGISERLERLTDRCLSIPSPQCVLSVEVERMFEPWDACTGSARCAIRGSAGYTWDKDPVHAHQAGVAHCQKHERKGVTRQRRPLRTSRQRRSLLAPRERGISLCSFGREQWR